MKKIAHRAFSIAAAIAALCVVHLDSARAAEPGRDPDWMVGVWRCTRESSPRPEIISIQPDGYAVIDAGGHILVGTARVEFPRPGDGVLVLAVKDSDLRDSIGTTVRLGLKAGENVMGTGFDNDRPFELNRLCHRMEAER